MNRRTLIPALAGPVTSRILVTLLLPALVAAFLCFPAGLHAVSASKFFKLGKAAEAREDYDAAFDNYQKAYKRDPKDLVYRAALARIRLPASALHLGRARKLIQAGDTASATAELLKATEIDPSNEAVQQEIAKLRASSDQPPATLDGTPLPQAITDQSQVESIGSPVLLKPVSNEPLSLHMTEDAKVIYQAIGKAAGINILFDPDYNSKRVPVDLNNVSLVDALRIVGTMSNTFWRPITANTIFVAQNSRVKRTELDEQAVQTFYLTNAWQQNDMTDVQAAVRNIMPNAKVYGVASQNAIVMRGTPDELLLAQKIIDDLDKARAEVVVDIAIMEVSKTWERTLGLSLPTSASVALKTSTSTSTGTTTTTTTSGTTTDTSSTPTIYNLAHLKASNFAVTLGSASLSMLLSDANTKILQSPRIRATDAQKASMKIGSRIPIATGSYSSGTASSYVSGLVNTQFQYQDVGVNIEMTPTIHYDRDVTIKIKIEVSSHTSDQNISGVVEPIISQRVVDQVIRLREGEASILGGIQDNQNKITWSGFPGLSSIPLLKYLFGSKDHNITDDEIVFVVVPHIVRSQSINASNLRPIDTGSGQTIELRHVDPLFVAPAAGGAPQQPVGHPAPAPVAHPVAANVAPIHSPNAEAAVTSALAQMSDSNRTQPIAQAAAKPAAQTPAATLRFTLPQPPAAQLVSGAAFQVPVLLNGATDLASVPIQFHYDPAKLALANVAAGDLLSRDGQAVALIHRDDGPGNLTVVASRPPGAPGVAGSGTVCVLTFQAKSAGPTSIAMTRAAALSSSQQNLAATPAQLNIEIK